MNEEKAREILGDTIKENGGLYNLGGYISWNYKEEICLDGDFDADELEAIAWWMKNKEFKSA